MRVHYLLVVLSLFSAVGVPAKTFDRPLVPDKETAIELAHAILQSYQGKEEFSRLLMLRGLDATDDGDAWTVCHCQETGPVYQMHAESIDLQLPIGLEVRISKHNAEVLEIYLAN